MNDAFAYALWLLKYERNLREALIEAIYARTAYERDVLHYDGQSALLAGWIQIRDEWPADRATTEPT